MKSPVFANILRPRVWWPFRIRLSRTKQTREHGALFPDEMIPLGANARLQEPLSDGVAEVSQAGAGRLLRLLHAGAQASARMTKAGLSQSARMRVIDIR
jgi:hypothetical protein